MKLIITTLVLLTCVIHVSCQKEALSDFGSCGEGAERLYQKGMVALHGNELKNAKKNFLRTIRSCDHSEAYIGLAEIFMRDGLYEQAEIHYKKALYIYNLKMKKSADEITREKIANLFYQMALLKARQGKKSQSVAFLWEAVRNGLNSKQLVINNPILGILKDDAVLKLLIEKFDKITPQRNAVAFRYFAYFEGFNPFKLNGEISAADYNSLISNNTSAEEKKRTLIRNKIKIHNGLVYKVSYNEKNKPVMMEMYRLNRGFTPYQKMMTYYFDLQERLEQVVDYHPQRKNWGTVSDYYYSGETTRITRIVRKVLYYPYYIEKILIENFTVFNY